MQQTTRALGLRAEQLAADFLVAHGYRIIDRNFRAEGGEIDLVAWDGSVLCFIEVRSRGSVDFGGPLETISRHKISRVVRAARQYLEKLTGPWPEMRFDAVGIVMQETPEFELIKGAFEA